MTVGMGLAVEQYGSSFYENGSQASGVFEHPNQIGKEALENLRNSLDSEHKGVKKSHKNMILEEGMTWKQITIPQDDAQFIESRKFQNTEVARWYGVPPHKLMEMEKSTFNNIEQQNIEFVTDALLTWIKRLEMEANIKLVAPRSRGKIRTKLNLNGLLRGDTEARSNYYNTMWSMGAFSANDILELEDRNPIGPEGDKRLVQLNLTTLDKVGEEPDNPPAEDMDDPEAATQDQGGAPDTGRELIENVAGRILRREHHRAVEALSKKDLQIRELSSWFGSFKDGHQSYIKSELAPVLDHLGIKINLDQFAEAHMSQLLTDIINAFDLGYLESPIVETSEDMAKSILEWGRNENPNQE